MQIVKLTIILLNVCADRACKETPMLDVRRFSVAVTQIAMTLRSVTEPNKNVYPSARTLPAQGGHSAMPETIVSIALAYRHWKETALLSAHNVRL